MGKGRLGLDLVCVGPRPSIRSVTALMRLRVPVQGKEIWSVDLGSDVSRRVVVVLNLGRWLQIGWFREHTGLILCGSNLDRRNQIGRPEHHNTPSSASFT